MILVTGGTGLVGSHLLYFLLQEHNAVRAIYRESSDREKLKQIFSYYSSEISEIEKMYSRIEWVVANINDIPALETAFKGITRVYHAAAFISFNSKDFRKLKKINIEGTANIVNQCLLHKVEKLCYVSTIATLGSTVDSSLINEKSDWNPEAKNSVYAITKYGAEMEVWRGTQEGLNAVIVNPGVIFGEGFWSTGSGIIMNIGSRGIPIYTSGGVGLVDVRDVVSVMIKLTQSEIKNERYILVSKNIFYKDLMTTLALAFNKKPPRKSIQKWKLMMVSNVDWFFNLIFRTKRKLLKATVHSLYDTSFYDSSKVKNELVLNFIPFEDTLSRVTESYKIES
ncbi:NAD-dependent epimerase [Patiriisocius marinistellae]|uniref:NAD-dependent epimerase n=1 Tax=Patiriisocius marinistellae TaxID=2494560 RepID=A0A5J4FU86_9FLAO|nr:NAD-dependent epimerase/dehydratase family protein [Patiriisocius marinistellae]GEQ84574.1 NAD-dependent epimerase [Patiriisocius marinistellae]